MRICVECRLVSFDDFDHGGWAVSDSQPAGLRIAIPWRRGDSCIDETGKGFGGLVAKRQRVDRDLDAAVPSVELERRICAVETKGVEELRFVLGARLVARSSGFEQHRDSRREVTERVGEEELVIEDLRLLIGQCGALRPDRKMHAPSLPGPGERGQRRRFTPADFVSTLTILRCALCLNGDE